jgi:hypothetical protein
VLFSWLMPLCFYALLKSLSGFRNGPQVFGGAEANR